MKKITIEIPDQVEINATELKTILAAKLYESGKLSLGQAANIAGHTKRTFMGLLGKYGVSVFNYPVTEIDKDLINAQYYHL